MSKIENTASDTATVTTDAMTTAVVSAGADTTVAAPAAAEVKAPKSPSKKSQALAIFNAKMVEREQGLFAANKDFRAAVLAAIQAQLGVSVASAATMYNAAKVEAEAANPTVGLGRDPKKVKVKVEGAKRGRPAGSKNKETVAVTVDVATPAATDAAVAEAVSAAEPALM